MRLLACIAIFFLPIIGGVAKHTVFHGTGPIWPWFLLACAVASLFDWRAAVLIAVGVGGSQFLERTFADATLLQFGWYSLLAFLGFSLLGPGVGATLAIVAGLYFAATVEMLAWFPAVVATEFALTFGLIGVTWYGGGGGGILDILGPIAGRSASLGTLAPVHGHRDPGDGAEGAEAQPAAPVAGDQKDRG